MKKPTTVEVPHRYALLFNSCLDQFKSKCIRCHNKVGSNSGVVVMLCYMIPKKIADCLSYGVYCNRCAKVIIRKERHTLEQLAHHMRSQYKGFKAWVELIRGPRYSPEVLEIDEQE